MKRIEVAAAIIVAGDGRFFITQRGYGEFKDRWEFPGGKTEAGETPEEALVREIKEELDTVIRPERLLGTVEYDYPAFHLTMHCYICSIVSGELTLLEHEASCWTDAGSIGTIDWLPADRIILPALKEYLKVFRKSTDPA